MPKLALAFDVTANTAGASRSLDKLGDKVERTGRRVGGLTGTIGRPLLALAGAGGVGALIGSSVKLAATFETTMRQVAVATNTPGEKLKDLNSLALKMGADTTFSAQQAGDAMLELAKGGLEAAEIKAGALASTLTLAAAGQLELGEAAGYVVQGLSTFNLGAEKAAEVAAALAGGANASTASVQDMGLALSQVGPGAVQAGLSLQETTAVLAAFAQNGIKGSDAGTSLKTMLTRLIPQTDKAQAAMEAFGLSFVDGKGNIDDITVVAQKLQKRLSKLSDEQRTTALATIFGSDATRAASILMKEGAEGLRKYIKATSDRTQAEKLAKAATDGTGGALEQMRGSIETAQIALGTALAPVVVDVAKKVSAFANGPLTQEIIPAIDSFVQGMRDGEGPGGKFADVVGELGDAARSTWSAAKPLFGFIGDHPKLFAEVAKDAVIFAGAMKALSLVRGIRGGVAGVVGSAAGRAPIPVVVTNLGALTGPGAGGPIVTPGTGTKAGKAPGRFATIAASSLTVNALAVLDSVLVPKAADAAFNKLPELLKVDQQRRELERLYDQIGTLDEKTQGILQSHVVEVQNAYTEAAKGNFDEIKRVYEVVMKDYQTGLTEAERKARSDIAAKVMPQVIRDLGKAGTDGGRAFTDSLSGMLIGVPLPKPKVGIDDTAATKKLRALRDQLEWLSGRTVNTTVGVKIRTDNGLPLPTGARAGLPGDATGGWIRGYGTGTSDSNIRRVSNGEFVVNARDAKANAATLEAINAGRTPALAGGPTYGDVYVTVADNRTALSVPEQLRQDAWLKGF